MKLIKLKDKFILVNDEDIEKGDSAFQINFKKTSPQIIKIETVSQSKIANDKNGSYSKFKIIAGIPELPEIDFSLLSEEDCKEIGWVDVEKLSYDFDPDKNSEARKGFIEGFKTAQSLSDKMFSLDDMKKALWELGDVLFNNNQNGIKEGEPKLYFDSIIQSLQQTEWDVEVGKEYISDGLDEMGQPQYSKRIKITDGKIKVIKIL